MAKCEQADGHRKRKGGYHQYLKRLKSRQKRHTARQSLKKGEQPSETYGKYRGWES